MFSPTSEHRIYQPVEPNALSNDDGPAMTSIYPFSLPSVEDLYGALFDLRGVMDPRDPLSLSAISAEVHHDRSVVDDIRRQATSRPSETVVEDLDERRQFSWAKAYFSVDGDVAGQEQEVVTQPNRAIEEAAPNKKPRGRPRVEARNETAVDRRRTQIRLAQRAYRHRKESTISTLRERISELEGVLDEMNSAFLQFNDHAVERGIFQSHPEIAGNLKKTTQHFLALARRTQGAAEAGSSSDARNEASGENSDENHNGNQDGNPRSIRGEVGQKRRRGQDTPTAAATGRKTTASKDSLETFGSSHLHPSYDRTDTRLSTTPSPSYNLPLPFTYSVQEPTFARRLQRRSLEVAYQMLLSPSISQMEKNRKFFRFSCFGINQDRAITALRHMLMRTTEEPLGCVEPNIQQNNRQIYRPFLRSTTSVLSRTDRAWHVQSINSPQQQNPSDPVMDLTSYNGEWFDSGDVEDYLQRKGVRLSESAYAEIDVPDGMADELALQPVAPRTRNAYVEVDETDNARPSVLSPATFSQDMVTTTNTPVHGPFGIIFDQAMSGNGAYGGQLSRTQTVTIDVTMLLDGKHDG
ncbi:MAG: hypothetical protein M1823_005926 [Watsoniomyces obsoletus]|nr:MAG: hypothetical protein M1823_005926 [Watsoniomyces obsoletus]